MPRLNDCLPEGADELLALAPEEVGAAVLNYVCEHAATDFIPANIAGEVDDPSGLGRGPYGARADDAKRAVMAGFAWLLAQGLIAWTPEYGQYSNGAVFVTRRGRQHAGTSNLDAYRRATSLSPDLLHPNLRANCWRSFLGGDYDTAVLQAFKAVEEVVRDAGGYTASDIGVALMRSAFDKNRGPLTDQAQPEGERDALAHLFAGAIGSYKNPIATERCQSLIPLTLSR